MSFLKQLLTPFVEFDNDGNKQPGPQKKTGAPVPATKPASATVSQASQPNLAPDVPVQHPLINNTAPANTPAQLATYSPAGTLTGPLPEHTRYFEQLIDDANKTNPAFQGTDFKEFVDSKLDIDDIQDEALKYKTAFNVLKSTGLTKEKLFSTGQEYLDIVGRDMNAFQGAHSQKYQKEVRTKEQQIQLKAGELQVLSQKINALKAEINQLTQEINLTKDNLGVVKHSYLLAGENKQNEIQAELDKIAQYF